MVKKAQKNDIHKENRRVKLKWTSYSWLTFVLLAGFILTGYSALINITHLIADKANISKLNKTLKESEDKNSKLNSEISHQDFELIGRNTLKMAGPNETLIIINKPQEETNSQKIKTEVKHAQ